MKYEYRYSLDDVSFGHGILIINPTRIADIEFKKNTDGGVIYIQGDIDKVINHFKVKLKSNDIKERVIAKNFFLDKPYKYRYDEFKDDMEKKELYERGKRERERKKWMKENMQNLCETSNGVFSNYGATTI
jgi:hypothetical protein